MAEECIMSPHRVCPSPWRQQTRPILNWTWLKNGLWTTLWCQWIPRLLIHIYFKAAGVTGQKEKHMLGVCASTHSHTHKHKLAPTGSERPYLVHPHMEQRCSRSYKCSRKILTESSNLTTIHSCYWTLCKGKLNLKYLCQLRVLQTREGGAEWALLLSDSRRASVLEQSRAVQIKPPPLMFLFFHPLPSSRSYLFWPAQSQTPCQGHQAYAYTHIHTHSDVDSFMIYHQYLWGEENDSGCVFVRLQSEQLSMK